MLAHSPRIDMSPHSDILSWFWANQSLLFLHNAVCLAEKQHIPILESLIWPDQELELTIYRSRGKHTNHYTTYVLLHSLKKQLILYLPPFWRVTNIIFTSIYRRVIYYFLFEIRIWQGWSSKIFLLLSTFITQIINKPEIKVFWGNFHQILI